VIVGGILLLRQTHPQPARHAQMEDQHSGGTQVKQQILGSTVDGFDRAPDGPFLQRYDIYHLAELRLSYTEARDLLADQTLDEALADGFDFWEFGHDNASPSSQLSPGQRAL
jgi:hypothetical protein